MIAKKLLLATLAGALSMWVLAGVWHELIMAHFYVTQTHASHSGTGIILIAYLILGALMAFLYSRQHAPAARPMVEGLMFGIITGLLWVFPHELAMAGAHGGSIVYVLKNAAWHMVEQGVGGIVIAAVYRRYSQ